MAPLAPRRNTPWRRCFLDREEYFLLSRILSPGSLRGVARKGLIRVHSRVSQFKSCNRSEWPARNQFSCHNWSQKVRTQERFSLQPRTLVRAGLYPAEPGDLAETRRFSPTSGPGIPRRKRTGKMCPTTINLILIYDALKLSKKFPVTWAVKLGSRESFIPEGAWTGGVGVGTSEGASSKRRECVNIRTSNAASRWNSAGFRARSFRPP